jgi:hypothetical protein
MFFKTAPTLPKESELFLEEPDLCQTDPESFPYRLLHKITSVGRADLLTQTKESLIC